MDNKDFHSIIRNALTNYLFELNQSCYEQPECKKATSKCVDYLDSNLIDEQWLLNNHLVVYSACCCYHKSLDSSIKEAHVSSDEESLAKLRKEREVIIRVCQVFCVSFEKIFLGRESSPVLFSLLFNELIQ